MHGCQHALLSGGTGTSWHQERAQRSPHASEAFSKSPYERNQGNCEGGGCLAMCLHVAAQQHQSCHCHECQAERGQLCRTSHLLLNTIRICFNSSACSANQRIHCTRRLGSTSLITSTVVLQPCKFRFKATAITILITFTMPMVPRTTCWEEGAREGEGLVQLS
jgi:hypothetical protein